jgi:hypothetical protein
MARIALGEATVQFQLLARPRCEKKRINGVRGLTRGEGLFDGDVGRREVDILFRGVVRSRLLPDSAHWACRAWQVSISE